MAINTGYKRGAIVAACAVLATGIAGCGKSGSSTAATGADSGGKITVWMDAPRLPGVEAFKKAHPEIPINVVTIGTADSSANLQQKFTLFNQAGKGWPDAIFFPDNADIAWATSTKLDYAADLTNSVSAGIKSGYDTATIAPCMIDGKLRCLRNDTAPDVLWYNKTLFDKWGYTAPKTWEEYQAVGIKIATQHPGYVSGLLGDGYTTGRYLWASGCPISQRVGDMKALINTADPTCTRVKDMLGAMLKAKALTVNGLFDSASAALGDKLVMTPGAVWYGDYIFRDTFKVPAGQMTAAPSLYWSADAKHITGDEGGGLYGISSHITGAQLKNTVAFVEWMVSAKEWQVDLSTGLPAYSPLREAWLAKQNNDKYFADFDNMKKAILAAPSLVGSDYDYLQYNPTGIWTDTVTPAITKNGDFNAGWDAFSAQLADKAKTFGYSVVTSK